MLFIYQKYPANYMVYFFIIPFIICIIQSIITIHFITKLYCRTKKFDETKQGHQEVHSNEYDTSTLYSIDSIDKLLTGMSIIFGFIYVWSYYIIRYLIWSYIVEPYKTKLALYSGYCFIIFGCSRTTMYAYYFRRLYITFNGTVFGINECKFKCLKILFIISTVVFNVNWIVISVLDHEYNIYIISQSIGISIRVGSLFVYDTFWGIILMVLFISRLRKVTKINEQNNDTIKTVSKRLTVLACIAVLSTLIAFIIWHFNVDIGKPLSLFDVVINSICLILSFSQYSIYLKKYCFNCNTSCCQCNVTNKKSQTTDDNDINDDVKV